MHEKEMRFLRVDGITKDDVGRRLLNAWENASISSSRHPEVQMSRCPEAISDDGFLQTSSLKAGGQSSLSPSAVVDPSLTSRITISCDLFSSKWLF